MHISPVLWQFLVKWLTDFALFPPEASTIAPHMDALYFFLVLVSLIGLTIVDSAHGRLLHHVPQGEATRMAMQIEGSTLLEATWTIIPLACS